MTFVRRFLFSMLFVLLYGLSTQFAQGALLFGAEERERILGQEVEFLDDKAGKYSLQELLSAPLEQTFTPLSGTLNRGYTDATSWLRFNVARMPGAPETLMLWVETPVLDRVEVYVQGAGSASNPESYTRFLLGDQVPAVLNPRVHPRHVVPLELKREGIAYQVLVRVQTSSAHNVRMRLLSPTGYEQETQQVVFWQGGYLMVALALTIINALLALRLRDMVYGWYAAYLSTLFFSYLAIEGMQVLLWPDAAHLVSSLLAGGGTGLGYVTFTLFAMTIFATRQHHPHIHRFLQFVVALGVVTALTSATPYYGLFIKPITVLGLVLAVLFPFLAWRYQARSGDGHHWLLLAFLANTLGIFFTFIHLLGLVPSNEITRHALQYGSVVHMVLMTLALSGRVLDAESSARRAASASEERAVALAKEMTLGLKRNRQELAEALARESRMREEQAKFIDTISHEYRTPLSVIRTHLDILMVKTAGKERSRFETMSAAALRLQGIFNEALQANRMGRPPAARFERQDVCLLLEDVLHEFQRNFPSCQVDVALPDEPLIALVDSGLIKTVLRNLLENAEKYRYPRAPSTRVSVVAEAGGDALLVRVTNAANPALGLDRSRLFERFVRDSSAQQQPGMGLGLYLVRRIMFDHKGTVEVNRDVKDTFEITISLPLLSDE